MGVHILAGSQIWFQSLLFKDFLAVQGREFARGEVLPYISYIGMCRPKGYGFWVKHEKASDTLKHQPRGLQYLTHGFWAVLVWKRVVILTIVHVVLNRVWFSREPRERINVFVFSTLNEK